MSKQTNTLIRITGLLDRFLGDPETGQLAIENSRARLPIEVVTDLEAVLASNRISYRDGVLIQLAYGLEDPELDLTLRPSGARTVAADLGQILGERHVRAVKDAYQNIAKNTEVLTRGNFEQFDRLLTWANGAGETERTLALELACIRSA